MLETLRIMRTKSNVRAVKTAVRKKRQTARM